jgi:hypothetical protein
VVLVQIKDGSESAVDCGGWCNQKCGVGGACLANSDCISGVCTSGLCRNAPTCTNLIRDGRETDVVGTLLRRGREGGREAGLLGVK